MVSPSAPLGCENFLDFPCSLWPWQFRGELVCCLVQCLWTVSDVFLMMTLGLWIWERKTTDVKCHHTKGSNYQHDLSPLRSWCPAGGSVCQNSPLEHYSFFTPNLQPLTILHPLEENRSAQHILKGWGVLLPSSTSPWEPTFLKKLNVLKDDS